MHLLKLICLALSILLFIIYLVLCSIQDHRDKLVSRILHLIGVLSNIILYVVLYNFEFIFPLLQAICVSVIWIFFSFAKLYGLADAFVLMNITVLFAAFTGVSGGLSLSLLVLIFTCIGAMIGSVIKSRSFSALFKKTPHAMIPYISVSFFITTAMLLYAFFTK